MNRENEICKVFEIGVNQHVEEVNALYQFLERLKPRHIMEIGTDRGGLFYMFTRLANGLAISLDWPKQAFGCKDEYEVETRNRLMASWGPQVCLISGNSHEQYNRQLVANLLRGEKLDFLFIDGDHTYEGVKQDYEMYKDFVNGWIGFHDIVISDFHHSWGVYVGEFWNELRGNKQFFYAHPNAQDWGGLGFIEHRQ